MSVIDSTGRLIKWYCIPTLAITAFFWSWAIYNSFTSGYFDSGIVCFAITFVACIVGLQAVKSQSAEPARAHFILLVAGVALTSVIYGSIVFYLMTLKGSQSSKIVEHAIPCVVWSLLGGFCCYKAKQFWTLCVEQGKGDSKDFFTPIMHD